MDSSSRHEHLLRVFHLIDILFGARQPLTTAELKDRLQNRGVIDDMSDKNIRRDVDFLENLFAEGWWLSQLAARDPDAIWARQWCAHAPGARRRPRARVRAS